MLQLTKAAEFFKPFQFGVACSFGAETITHDLRACIENHWLVDNFVVLKVDMNTFNMVSRQALLSECSTDFPELLPWAIWCYSQHPILWHPLGRLCSEQGVHQGDPLAPLLFSLVLNLLVSEITSSAVCADLSFHAWYLDDGVLAGSRSMVLRALTIIQDQGPSLGLIKNIPNCEIFSRISSFPPAMKDPTAPICLFWAFPLVIKHSVLPSFHGSMGRIKPCCCNLKKWISNPHAAFSLLRQCARFFKMTHLARGIPPSQAMSALKAFDLDICSCFSRCTAVDTSDQSWQQAELDLSRGGLGLRSISRHSPAACIASLSSSGFSTSSQQHFKQAVEPFVPTSDAIYVEDVLTSPIHQMMLSTKVDAYLFNLLFEISLADSACLLSVSSLYAASWISVIPSEGLCLHLQPSESR